MVTAVADRMGGPFIHGVIVLFFWGNVSFSAFSLGNKTVTGWGRGGRGVGNGVFLLSYHP